MSLGELKKVKKFSQLQPRPEWFFVTRQELVRKAESQMAPAAPRWSLTWLELRYSFAQFSPKLVSLIVLVGLVGGVVAKANATFNPASPYYVIKTTIEDVQLAVTLNPTSKAKVLIQHSQTRRNEALQLVKDTSLKPEEKAAAISQVVQSLGNSLVAANASLEIANNAQTSQSSAAATQAKAEVTQVANDIASTAKAAVTDLQQVQKELVSTVLPITTATSTPAQAQDNKDAKQQVVDTLQTLNKAATQVSNVEAGSLLILATNVASKTAADNSANSISAADVQSLVADKLNRVAATIDQTAASIKTAEGTAAKQDSANQANGVTLPVVLPKDVAATSSVVVLNAQDAKEAVAQTDNAKKAIDQAKQALTKQDDLTGAVNKLVQAQKLNDVSQAVIQNAAVIVNAAATSSAGALDQKKPAASSTPAKIDSDSQK